MENNKTSLKVSDVLPTLNQKLVDNIALSIKKLSELSIEYMRVTSLFDLEALKKEYNSELIYFAELYSKTRAFKGNNHVYLEREIKELKSITIDMLLKEGVNSTKAETLVYSHPYYTERLNLFKKIMSFLITTEEKYARFEQTLNCIIQSISIYGKEYIKN